jgi:hypothetical protein
VHLHGLYRIKKKVATSLSTPQAKKEKRQEKKRARFSKKKKDVSISNKIRLIAEGVARNWSRCTLYDAFTCLPLLHYGGQGWRTHRIRKKNIPCKLCASQAPAEAFASQARARYLPGNARRFLTITCRGCATFDRSVGQCEYVCRLVGLAPMEIQTISHRVPLTEGACLA